MDSLQISCDMLHYKRIREDPLYRLQLQVFDLRAELEPAHSQYIPKETTQEVEEPEWTKRQWDVVSQLRADQINLRKTLHNTLKEIKAASASKRKTNRYTNYL